MEQKTDIKYNKLRETTAIVKEKYIKDDALFLYFTVFTVTTTWLVGATTTVWTSPAIVKMKSNDTRINPIGKPITTTEISMMFALPGSISLIGCAFLPKLADLIGRKLTVEIMAVGMFVSMIGLAFSNTSVLIILYYTATVVGNSALMVIVPIYLTEICEDHNRAKFGCLIVVCFPVGQLYSYAIGPFFSVRDYTLLTAAPMVIFLALSYFIPESPVYLLKKGKEKECRRTLKKLRSNKSVMELEFDFDEIRRSVKGKDSDKMGILKLFSTKEGRLGVLLGTLPLVTQYLCGMAVILPLMAPILDQSGSNISGDYIALISGLIKCFAFVLTFLVIERIGRKPLLIISTIGSGVSLSALGIFFYMNHINSPLVNDFRWFPIICIIIFVVSYSLGLGPIPISSISTLFPVELRSIASALIITSTYVIVTMYRTVYPLLSETIGIHWCLGIFAFSCFIGAYLIYIMLPETVGKSIEEIQDILKNY